MLKLSKEAFQKVSNLLKNDARNIEKCLYEYYFEDGRSENVAYELKKYENADGGFGNALESDFRLPNSSPMATSIGIRILTEIEETKETREMIKSALKYLELTFDKKRCGLVR